MSWRLLSRRSASVGCAVAAWLTAAAYAHAAPPPVDFNRDVRPIVSDKCFACHGPDANTREADLRLDVETEAKLDRGGYAAIVPGKLDESELVRRITSDDESERMPPVDSGKKLSKEQIELLKRWVAEGAPWSLAWAYVPPAKRVPPTVSDKSWPKNWADQFILGKIESAGLKPSPDADKTTLIRRVYIDLIGLPPKPEEVDAFLADDSPDAYEKVVDRLLASPHYGERMAMYWLDLVRYADTVGYHGDQEQHIQPYRDWVINAFNANRPFDQFTREQLAGDLLPEPTREQKIATGYNRLLQTSHEGGVQAKEYLAIYGADHVRNLSIVWMGATVGCAQCHDHKYDPYTTRDFYSMQAFFADVDEARHLGKGVDASPTLREPEMALGTPTEVARWDEAVAKKNALDKQLEKAKAKDANDTDAIKRLDERIAQAKAALQALDKSTLRTMVTVAIEPRVTRILPRGNWLDDGGEIVQPAIPEFLGMLPIDGDRRATRLDLANWLTDARGGAGGPTARVMANRLWYLTFGRGVSPSLDDFGGQGEPPDNPELLDALANEFVDIGWDVKHMMKLLVTSRAYRQSSVESAELREKDPLNKLVARQASYRYPAESVRDAALQIGGLLVPTIGGYSARPYQPAGYLRHLNFPEREYVADTDKNQWRRGVYTHWQRQYLHPMLKAFDAPSREECTVARPRSNTALAALVLLNDPSFVEASKMFAVRILNEGGATTADRMDFAFRQAASRKPSPEEREAMSALLSRSQKYYDANPDAAEKLLSIGLAPAPEGVDRPELAAWTIIARATLNLHEVITRN